MMRIQNLTWNQNAEHRTRQESQTARTKSKPQLFDLIVFILFFFASVC